LSPVFSRTSAPGTHWRDALDVEQRGVDLVDGRVDLEGVLEFHARSLCARAGPREVVYRTAS
jgi:hypothetical protein